MSPFDEAKKNESTSPTNSKFNRDGLKLLEKYLDKWMIYLQCYPEMFEILGKFYTLDWSVWHHHSYKFKNAYRMLNFIFETESSLYQYTDVKLPNGRPFTKKDLINYNQYCY